MEICPEKGLGAQEFRCRDCKVYIGMGFGEERLCDYSGYYYCTNCHNNEALQIPARMVKNWDFSRHKVSRKSKEFLRSCYRSPKIPLLQANPFLETFSEEVRDVVVRILL